MKRISLIILAALLTSCGPQSITRWDRTPAERLPDPPKGLRWTNEYLVDSSNGVPVAAIGHLGGTDEMRVWLYGCPALRAASFMGGYMVDRRSVIDAAMACGREYEATKQ